MKKSLPMLLAIVLFLPLGIHAEGQAFIVDRERDFVPIPTSYEVYATIRNLGSAGFMNHPEDLFLGPDELLYVADTENDRVLKLDLEGNVLDIITSAAGVPFKKPRGVYVHDDLSVWVADTGNLRIATLNADLTDRKIYIKPDSALLASNFTFDVQKIFVNNAGYIYALKGANLISLDEGNGFRGYFGATEVGFSLSRFLTRLLGSKSQVERTVKQEPASYSNFYIGADQMIYGILSTKSTAQIRKLNSVGSNTYPEDTYGIILKDKDNKPLEPFFADITVEKNGILSLVDKNSGLVYQYDQEGNLLCCFGGLGDSGGRFQIPISIVADSRGYLYVLDYATGIITIFQPTRFIRLIHQAVTLHGEGRYEEALDYWKDALEIDSNFALAHQGIAKVMGKQEKWEASMRAYYLADDKEGYSEAFAEYRHGLFRQYFLLVVALAAAVIFICAWLLSRGKQKADVWADDIQMGRGLK